MSCILLCKCVPRHYHEKLLVLNVIISMSRRSIEIRLLWKH